MNAADAHREWLSRKHGSTTKDANIRMNGAHPGTYCNILVPASESSLMLKLLTMVSCCLMPNVLSKGIAPCITGIYSKFTLRIKIAMLE